MHLPQSTLPKNHLRGHLHGINKEKTAGPQMEKKTTITSGWGGSEMNDSQVGNQEFPTS